MLFSVVIGIYFSLYDIDTPIKNLTVWLSIQNTEKNLTCFTKFTTLSPEKIVALYITPNHR